MKPWQNLLTGLLMGVAVAAFLYIIVREPPGDPIKLLPPPTPMPMFVQVSGAVMHPGVYQLPRESRVQQAIVAAGGFTDDAAQLYVNQAARLVDGQMVVVPVIGESAVSISEIDDAPLNLNSATAEELDELPGIGPTRAEAILTYRAENGPFAIVEDLLNVPGIGADTFERLAPLVSAP